MTVRIDGTNSTANPAITGADTDTGLQLGTDEIQFVTGGTNRATVESDGDFTVEQGDLNLSDGNLVLAENHGINFHPQGGSNVNLLDDYEEGTFTPFFTSSSATNLNASIVSAYNIQDGYYTKVGDLVNVQLYIQTNSTSWTYTNGGANHTAQVPQYLQVGGLPFTIRSSLNHYPAANCGYFATWTGWSAGYTPMGYGLLGQTRIQMVYPVGNGIDNITTDYIANLGSQLIISISYFT